MRIIVFIILIYSFFISCEKQPFDYRVKYYGKYEFTHTSIDRSACFDSSYVGCEDTLIFKYTGEVTKSTVNNGINLILPQNSYFVVLDISGRFDSNDQAGISGSFDKDGGVLFIFKRSGPGSITAGANYVVGEKID